jgi:hypothetical protein
LQKGVELGEKELEKCKEELQRLNDELADLRRKGRKTKTRRKNDFDFY